MVIEDGVEKTTQKSNISIKLTHQWLDCNLPRPCTANTCSATTGYRAVIYQCKANSINMNLTKNQYFITKLLEGMKRDERGGIVLLGESIWSSPWHDEWCVTLGRRERTRRGQQAWALWRPCCCVSNSVAHLFLSLTFFMFISFHSSCLPVIFSFRLIYWHF